MAPQAGKHLRLFLRGGADPSPRPCPLLPPFLRQRQWSLHCPVRQPLGIPQWEKLTITLEPETVELEPDFLSWLLGGWVFVILWMDKAVFMPDSEQWFNGLVVPVSSGSTTVGIATSSMHLWKWWQPGYRTTYRSKTLTPTLKSPVRNKLWIHANLKKGFSAGTGYVTGLCTHCLTLTCSFMTFLCTHCLTPTCSLMSCLYTV